MTRVRSSKSRDHRYYSATQSLVVQWRDAIRKHEPLHPTFERISTWIRRLDVTISQRTSPLMTRSTRTKHLARQQVCKRWLAR